MTRSEAKKLDRQNAELATKELHAPSGSKFDMTNEGWLHDAATASIAFSTPAMNAIAAGSDGAS